MRLLKTKEIKNLALTLMSFAKMRLLFIPVQLLLELEANLLVQNLIELEFELSRM
jgi:hypothetical protein